MKKVLDRLQFYTTNALGAKQAMTPEGFLVCSDVPIARTGEMVYGPDETPLPCGPNGTITVVRDADEVFRPEYILSYAGKPVVDDHPEDEVNPDNWRDLAVGVVMNPRRGLGDQADLLVADLMITHADAIRAVRSGKREVSCGYDADYEELEAGRGRQLNMIGNHVALVQSGRCGPRCAISDHRTTSKGDDMRTHDDVGRGVTVAMKIRKWLDKVKAAVKAKDEAELERLEDEMPEELKKKAEEKKDKTDDDDMPVTKADEHTHVHIHGGAGTGDDDPLPAAAEEHSDGNEARFASIEETLAKLCSFVGMPDDPGAEEAMEGELEAEAPMGTGDKARKAKDSAYMEDSFQQTASMAEILAPGIRIPVFDRASNPKKTLDAICAFRRTALDLAWNTAETRGVIEEVNGNKPLVLDGMTCGAVRTLFRGAAAAVKAANNGGQRRSTTGDDWAPGGPGGPKRPLTLRQLNEAHAKHYAKH